MYGQPKTFSYSFIRIFVNEQLGAEEGKPGRGWVVEELLKGINNAEDAIKRASAQLRGTLDTVDQYLAAGHSIPEQYVGSSTQDLNRGITLRTHNWNILTYALTDYEMAGIRAYLAGRAKDAS